MQLQGVAISSWLLIQQPARFSNGHAPKEKHSWGDAIKRRPSPADRLLRRLQLRSFGHYQR
jgi:hypothetical protein